MSTISATRRGFLYQDRFAVALYLEKLQCGDIKEFYIDYPLAGQKSLDIKRIDGRGSEIIYEVKSGEEFKKDKRKKESSEIRDAFINLGDYLKINPNAKLNLVIRKGLVEKIASYWERINHIRSHAFALPETTTRMNWLLNRLKLPEIKSIQELYDLLQQVEVFDFNDDRPNNDNDPFPDIDDYVLRKIEDISNMFNADVCQYEYPPQILMLDLYHKCRLHSGTRMEMHLIFLTSVIEFIAHRKYIDKGYDPNANRGEIKEKMKKEVGEQMRTRLRDLLPIDKDIIAQNKPEGQDYEVNQ